MWQACGYMFVSCLQGQEQEQYFLGEPQRNRNLPDNDIQNCGFHGLMLGAQALCVYVCSGLSLSYRRFMYTHCFLSIASTTYTDTDFMMTPFILGFVIFSRAILFQKEKTKQILQEKAFSWTLPRMIR